MFRLRKWYFDFLTPANEYVFVYFATLRLAGYTIPSLTVHAATVGAKSLRTRYLPIPSHEVREGEDGAVKISFPCGQISVERDVCSLTFDSRGCTVDLQYEAAKCEAFSPLLISTGTKNHISWRPLQLKYDVSGSISLDGGRIEAHGAHGYADYIESTFLPPIVPVRHLFWGRLHHDEIDISFVRAMMGGSSREWSALCGQSGSGKIVGDRVSMSPDFQRTPGVVSDTGKGYQIRATTTHGEIQLRVRHVAVVQEGSFIDQQEISSPILRAAAKALTRNPTSSKYLSLADVILVEGEAQRVFANISMIDEYAQL